jgi:putative transposase
MRKFKSMGLAQRFLNVHSAVYNLFNQGRHFASVKNYRFLGQRAFASWEKAVAINKWGQSKNTVVLVFLVVVTTL